MRYIDLVPTNLPHKATQDIKFRDYLIPKTCRCSWVSDLSHSSDNSRSLSPSAIRKFRIYSATLEACIKSHRINKGDSMGRHSEHSFQV